MNLGDRHVGLRSPQLEVELEVAWVDRTAEPGRKDLAAAAPHVTGCESSSDLLDPMPLECAHSDPRQGSGASEDGVFARLGQLAMNRGSVAYVLVRGFRGRL